MEELLRLARHSPRSAWLYQRSQDRRADARAGRDLRAKIGQRWAFLARELDALESPFFKPHFDEEKVQAVRRALAAGTLRVTEYGFAAEGKPLHEITWKAKKDDAGEWWSSSLFSNSWI